MARYQGRCRWVAHPTDADTWTLVFDPKLTVPSHCKFDLSVPGPPLGSPDGEPAAWIYVGFDFTPIAPRPEIGRG